MAYVLTNSTTSNALARVRGQGKRARRKLYPKKNPLSQKKVNSISIYIALTYESAFFLKHASYAVTEEEAVTTDPNDPCASNPCKNEGTCLDMEDGTVFCFCHDGFSGDFCEEGL